jgi:hypothetical protein
MLRPLLWEYFGACHENQEKENLDFHKMYVFEMIQKYTII